MGETTAHGLHMHLHASLIAILVCHCETKNVHKHAPEHMLGMPNSYMSALDVEGAITFGA